MSDGTYDSEQIISAIGGISGSGPAMNATTTTVMAGQSAVVALPFNFSRKSFVIWNMDSLIYIKLGLNISGSSFSFMLNAGKYFGMDNYGGPVMVQAVNSNSNVLITELS